MHITIRDIQTQRIVCEDDLNSERNELVLGRSSGCDLVLPGSSISRRHGRLLYVGDAVFIEDLKSTCGILVNNAKISDVTSMEPGDSAIIGNYAVTLSEQRQQGNADQPPREEAVSPQQVVEPAPQSKKEPPPANQFLDEFKNASILYEPEAMALQKSLHEEILNRMNLTDKKLLDLKDRATMESLEKCMEQVLLEHRHELPVKTPLDMFRQALRDELIGFGPISVMLRSPKISEIMINGPDCVFVESMGKLYETGVRFFNEQHLLAIIQRIVEPLGRHIDDTSPMVDARLPDGSRVNAVIPPLALQGASVTIRKFAEKKLTSDDLVGFGSMTKEMALFLQEAVRMRKNILVSGGTGSGKTTLLNVLSMFIPQGERVVTIEDSAELKLSHRNLVSLEARPANIEGKGAIAIKNLVINALRMRPDRIIVGECRGAEALDMLQAMNTGHDGSLTTCHANNPRDALSRLETMVMMAGYDLPSSAIRDQISSALDVIVQQSRLSDGSRKIVKISEITGREKDVVVMQDIFEFMQTGLDKDGHVEGYHTATGNIPTFIEELRRSGALRLDMSVFVPKG